MGKADKRTKRGKVFKGTYGKSRSKKQIASKHYTRKTSVKK